MFSIQSRESTKQIEKHFEQGKPASLVEQKQLAFNICTLIWQKWPFHSPPCNVGFNNPQHVDRSFVEFYKRAIKNLTQAEKLQHLADLRADTIGTRTQKKASIIYTSENSKYPVKKPTQ